MPIEPMATSRLGSTSVGRSGRRETWGAGGSCWGRDRSSCVEMQDDAGAQQPVAASEKALAETVSEKIQALKVQPRVQQVLQSSACTRFNTWWSVEKHRVALSRCLISTYFLNVWVSSLQMWWIGRAGFPFLTLGLVVPAVLLVANRWMHITGWVLLAEIAKDCTSLLWGVFLTWMYRGTFYLNELMVKKLSMLGVTLLVIYQHYSSDSSKKNPLAGLIGPDSTKTPSSKESVALLVSRLLLTSLFIWAGQAEIRRQLASVHDDGQGHQVHDRPAGDGHDQLWAKAAQFICSLPLCLGFKTRIFCSALATVCLLEALVQWSGLHWYGSGCLYDWAGFGTFYKMHAREHFVVNVGVAGGLMLLWIHGAGKYSMDEYLKKTD